MSGKVVRTDFDGWLDSIYYCRHIWFGCNRRFD
jgi:hypothetical protein